MPACLPYETVRFQFPEIPRNGVAPNIHSLCGITVAQEYLAIVSAIEPALKLDIKRLWSRFQVVPCRTCQEPFG